MILNISLNHAEDNLINVRKSANAKSSSEMANKSLLH